MSPAEDFIRLLDDTQTPRDTTIAAVIIPVVVGLTFAAFDLLASGYLRRVIVASVEQFQQRSAEMWELSTRQVLAGTICREMGGVTSGIVGGLDLLKTSGLAPGQQEILARRDNRCPLLPDVLSASLLLHRCSNVKSRIVPPPCPSTVHHQRERGRSAGDGAPALSPPSKRLLSMPDGRVSPLSRSKTRARRTPRQSAAGRPRSK